MLRISRNRRALVVTQTVLFLGLVGVGLMALAVDTGFMFASRAEMQRVADVAALAGATALQIGETTVRDRAVEIAGANNVNDSAVTGGELTVEVGNWEGFTRTFTPATGFELVTPNAVRATGARANIPLIFARFLGINESQVTRSATAISGSGVCGGIWGIGGLSVNGNVTTDSYVSTAGAYGGSNVHPNGDLCSCREVVISGSVEIFGDVRYGEGYDLTVHGTPAEIYGTRGETSCGLTVPEIDIEAAAAENDNATIGLTDEGRNPLVGNHWDLRLSGQDNLTLTGGTYYFNSILIVGDATLTITGPTTIYIEGDARFAGGGIVNATQNPQDLTIYSTGGNLDITGTAGFYGAIIAPDTDVDLTGTSEFFGILVGGFVSIPGNTDIHVDETLVEEFLGLRSVAPILVQ